MVRAEMSDEGGGAGDLFGEPVAAEPPRPCSCKLFGKTAIVLILAIVVVAIMATKLRRKEPPASPGSAAQSAQGMEQTGDLAVEPGQDTALASVNGQEITLGQLEESLGELPPQYKAVFEHRKHEFLEELIIRKLLLEEARSMKMGQAEAFRAAVEPRGQRADEEQAMVEALLRTEVLDRVEVTEGDLRAFYEAHKEELLGDPPFDEVKDMLLPYAEQDKQGEAIESYVEDLRARATIVRDEAWVEQQKARAADNPLDRALMSGRPVLADFGRGVCIPCKMMKPILDDLAEEYQGKAEILIIEIDNEPALARRCRIRVIPTQIFYDASGKEVYRHEGFMPREDIVAQLTRMGVP